MYVDYNIYWKSLYTFSSWCSHMHMYIHVRTYIIFLLRKIFREIRRVFLRIRIAVRIFFEFPRRNYRTISFHKLFMRNATNRKLKFFFLFFMSNANMCFVQKANFNTFWPAKSQVLYSLYLVIFLLRSFAKFRKLILNWYLVISILFLKIKI